MSAPLQPAVSARCSCTRWLVARCDIGRPCRGCAQPLRPVDTMPPAIPQLPPAELEEQRAGVAAARLALDTSGRSAALQRLPGRTSAMSRAGALESSSAAADDGRLLAEGAA